MGMDISFHWKFDDARALSMLHADYDDQVIVKH